MFGLVIPTFNFASDLEKTFLRLSEWRARHPQYPFRVCFVDDGSHDNTVSLLEAFARQNATWVQAQALGANLGKGAAVRAGFIALAPTCPQILFTDCDLYYGLDLIPRALQELDSADIVVLDRTLFSSYGKRSFYRNLASRLFNKFITMLTGVSIFDTQTGFKAFRTDICLPIFQHLSVWRFAFDVEVLAHASKYLLRIHSLPVILSDTKREEWQKSTIRLSTGFEVLVDLLRIACVIASTPAFDQEMKAKLRERATEL